MEVAYLVVPLAHHGTGIARYTSGVATIALTTALPPGRDGGVRSRNGRQQQESRVLMHDEVYSVFQKCGTRKAAQL